MFDYVSGPVLTDLRRACRAPGCPVCRVAREHSARVLRFIFSEKSRGRRAPAALRASLGFCPRHLRQAAAYERRLSGNWSATAAIYADLAREASAWLARLQAPRGPWEYYSSSYDPTLLEPCPVCAFALDSVDSFITSLLDSPGSESDPMAAAYTASDGLCLPHLAMALRRTRSPEVAQRLLAPVLAYADAPELSNPLPLENWLASATVEEAPVWWHRHSCSHCAALEERWTETLDDIERTPTAPAVGPEPPLCAVHMSALIREGGTASEALLPAYRARARDWLDECRTIIARAFHTDMSLMDRLSSRLGISQASYDWPVLRIARPVEDCTVCRDTGVAGSPDAAYHGLPRNISATAYPRYCWPHLLTSLRSGARQGRGLSPLVIRAYRAWLTELGRGLERYSRTFAADYAGPRSERTRLEGWVADLLSAFASDPVDPTRQPALLSADYMLDVSTYA